MTDPFAFVFTFTAILALLVVIGAALLLAQHLSPSFRAWCERLERWV